MSLSCRLIIYGLDTYTEVVRNTESKFSVKEREWDVCPLIIENLVPSADFTSIKNLIMKKRYNRINNPIKVGAISGSANARIKKISLTKLKGCNLKNLFAISTKPLASNNNLQSTCILIKISHRFSWFITPLIDGYHVT